MVEYSSLGLNLERTYQGIDEFSGFVLIATCFGSS